MRNKEYYNKVAQRQEMLDWVEGSKDAFRQKMEMTRLSNNYSCTDFSEILGYDSQFAYRNMFIKDRQKVTLDSFLRFCYQYGYDVQSVSSLAPRQTDRERVILEMAAVLACLPPEGLSHLSDKIEGEKAFSPEMRRKFLQCLERLYDLNREGDIGSQQPEMQEKE